MESICLKPALQGMMPSVSASLSRADGRVPSEKPTVTPPARRFSFRLKPLEFLRLSGGKEVVIKGKTQDPIDRDTREMIGGVEERDNENTAATEAQQNENWVLKILRVGSVWRRKDEKESEEEEEEEQTAVEDSVNDDNKNHCDSCKSSENDESEESEFDRDSFSTMLKRVTLTDAKLFAKLSYLGNLAYSIPKIKPEYLLKHHGLRFITSSIEKRELATRAEKIQGSNEEDEAETTMQKDGLEEEEQKNPILRISPSAAYRIAASAASYLYSQSKTILPFKPSKKPDMPQEESKESANTHLLNHSDMASLMATTDSVTAVVAAKEEVKQAVADDLNSTRSSPCHWFVCDDDETGTRYFVIQGSESLASWQANLLFEPVSFEGVDVLVHRGIYEVAKGIYEQMLPEIHAHLDSHGRNFRFTGHSLGGSLSLLVNLMLLMRGQVAASSLLPVVTFGSPSIMCGGDTLLQTLGLPKSHLRAITMHRDIVPRAFSCSYPNRVVEILRAVNRSFRNHPCLNKQKLLYSPMGELLILQPEEKISPHHHLLPSGSGLYILTCALSETKQAERQLQTAMKVFMNSPHPLEILADRSSYGSEGTIKRDHDMSSYLKSLKCVIRQELRQVRRAKRDRRRVFWWPRMAASGTNLRTVGSSIHDPEKLVFSEILQTGKDSLIRIGRFVASRNLHLVVLLFFPVRLLLVGAYGLIRFH